MSCGQRIKLKRKELGLTQTELANKVGLSFGSISKYEKDEVAIPSNTLRDIAIVLNVSVDYLIGLTDIIKPVEKIENELSKLNLSSTDYDTLIKIWCEDKQIILPTLKEDSTKLEKANSIIFDIYMNYLKSNSIASTEKLINKTYVDDKEIEFIKKHNEPIENAFINLLKSLDKNKIIAKTKTVDTNNNSALVLVYGTIPAGIPMECIEDIIDTEEISSVMLKGDKQYFGLKVKGDSMFPDYLDGDILILLKQDDCESGDDCVVMVNGNDGTFKRVLKNEKGIILQPLNNKYQPMVYTNEDIEKLPVKILGKVVELRRKK